MDSSSNENEEKEEFYDDIKLPMKLLLSPDDIGRGGGYYHIFTSDIPIAKGQCCDFCSEENTSDDEAINKKTYDCPHCGLRFLLSIALKYHIKGSHGDDHIYRCSECPFSSHILSQVRRHVRETHTMEKRYECPHCKYKAKRSTHLRRHIEARHDESKPPRYAARESNNNTTTATGTDGGPVEEVDEKPLVCDLCGYTTANQRSLTRHMKNSHENHSRYKCDRCEFTSNFLRELRHHVKVDHENAKCYDCPCCSYKTVHLGSLKNHVSAKHTDDKIYKCAHCKYRAVQAGNLKRHMKTRHPNIRRGRKPKKVETEEDKSSVNIKKEESHSTEQFNCFN